jgi:fermentation-respiration switch protein FrsA (DUF1100 family)
VRVLRILALAAGAYLLILVSSYFFQRRLQYFPDRDDPPAPEGAEDVRLDAADGTALRAWYWPGSRAPTLLLLHGNAGHRGDRLHLADGFRARGFGVFLLDYRGYGGSGGAPTEEGLLLDAQAAVSWLRARGATRLAYYGESLGCGVTAALAARERPRGIIFQSGADSLVKVAQSSFPWLPVRLFMKDRYDAAARMREVSCPVFSVHGSNDTLIRPALGRALYDASPGRHEWWLVPGASHNDIPDVAGAAFFDRLGGFLSSLDD